MRSVLLAVLGAALLLTPAWGQTKTPAKPTPTKPATAPAATPKPAAPPAAKPTAPAKTATPSPSAPAPATVPASPPSGPNEDRFIDELLSQKAVLWGHAAWLVGRAVGTFDESLTPDLAARKASETGWAPRPLGSDDPLNVSDFSTLLVEALAIPGGLMYQIFPGPRYAFRELVFRKIIPGTLASDAPVSGEEAMRYLQAAQDWKEAQK